MRAAIFFDAFDIRVVDRPDPVIEAVGDAIVRVTATCVCGSDLWYYRGLSPREHGQAIGHEFVGTVEDVGSEVSTLRVGDLVIAPFMWSDGDCAHCRYGMTTSCVHGGVWGRPGSDGGQGEAVRVPFADATLVRVPEPVDDERIPSLLALSDVMGTGHHAAVCAGVTPGSTVAVVGDGAVGLCGVIAAQRLGAQRIIALSRNPQRAELARRLGATEVIEARGEAATQALRELTSGVGVDSALECVGTAEAMRTAIGATRPGGSVGYVGMPHGTSLPVADLFGGNIGVRGGLAPVRTYLPELLDDVLAGTIDPGVVFDMEVALDDIAAGYAAMHEREAVKVLCRP